MVIGYLVIFPNYDLLDEDIKWMKKFGCDRVVKEDLSNHNYNISLINNVLPRLGDNGTLIVSKLSNLLLNSRQLFFLLRFFEYKNIRLISIHDEIDTHNLAFPNTTTSNILKTIISIDKDIYFTLKEFSFLFPFRKIVLNFSSSLSSNEKKISRNKKVVEMYLQQYSIKDIMRNCNIRSISRVFIILKQAGIKLNRKTSKLSD